MKKSNSSDRPKKPYAEFPLTPHASGAWQKKILGKIHYFGKWARRVGGKLVRIEGDGWKEALEEYKAVADDLHAGRTPRAGRDGLQVKDLCNAFLTSKVRKVEAGEMSTPMFAHYRRTTDQLVKQFGGSRLVEALVPEDFAALRATMAKRWGPVAVANAVGRVKSVFKYGFDAGLMDKPARFGPEFVKPDKRVMRKHRATSAPKMFDAAELRKLIDGAQNPVMRAMILLGVNCGFGNTDCSTLPKKALDLAGGWVDFPRPKNGIARRCSLWPETVAALRAAIAIRPEPSRPANADRVFLTTFGNPFIENTTEGFRKDVIGMKFGPLLDALGIHRKRVGFYALRHVFETVAGGSKDQVAVDLIMGHSDPSMGAVYREGVEDARLRAVAEHVRKWLFEAR
ncbi:MAG TPA: hypothetical protein VGE74_23110 [Gemmata sp.]